MADQESQTTPFAPAVVKSDQQPYTGGAIYTRRKYKQSNKTPVYLLAAVVISGSIFLLFASIFLRTVNPKLRQHIISIQNFNYENTNSTSSLNITMLTEVTVNNKNFGRYNFDNCNAVVLYGNGTIGGGGISGGTVGSRKSKSIRVTTRIGSDYLNLSSSSDLMEVTSFAKMTGRVHVMKIVNRRKSIELNCTMNLNLTSRSIVDSICR